MSEPLCIILMGLLWALLAGVHENSIFLLRWIQRLMSCLLYTLLGLVGDILTAAVNVTWSCRNISAVNGYLYSVLPNVTVLLKNDDCEQAWYNKAKEFLSDGTPLHFINETEHPLVVDAQKNNITVSDCIELHHLVTCHGLGQKFDVIYQVINDTWLTRTLEQQSNESILVSVLIPFLVLLILIAVVLIGIRCNRNQRSYDPHPNNQTCHIGTTGIVHDAEHANGNGFVSNGASNGAAQPHTGDTVTRNEQPDHSKI
ncbi:uncharacterized protein LOC124381763 [Silurus meridionalis]|uniref:Uncharacterized protein n=1 Tax=Silurus meridionalis TaxID=175797 RepID=A0A8T0A5K2_SILME|nr:uncharacterized protein LOC124381763 [Silurus meridionalis]XP_046699573.1 uncharacterized protein LOC124381763 [Silurus meridionalis]KAF7686401.1 hypothetical protein HF521_015763 [Silurus meridionalis]